MKNSKTTPTQSATPSAVSVAAQTDGSRAAAGKSSASSQKKPLTAPTPPSAKTGGLDAAKVQSPMVSQSPAGSDPQTTAPQKPDEGQKGKSSSRSLVKTQFNLKAPTAKAVKLAADFTDWEKSPLNLTKAANGVWQAVVPLSPGEHSYRFIVDGQWHDDPHPDRKHVANPFGSVNAVIHVA